MKKNNKGFSLVELIVVVLIMGIIAVALAPQVMKWVGEARTNSDKNTAKDIKSSIQIAVADTQSVGGSFAVASSTVFNASGITTLSSTSGLGTLASKIQEVTGGDYPTTADNGYFSFTIDASGVVNVTK